MNNHIILNVITILLIPFLFIFAAYVQLRGEYSAGGGFQAGVIFATSVILIAQIYGLEIVQRRLPIAIIKILASIGVIIYGLTGTLSFLSNVNFLNYSMLSSSSQQGQQIGILLVEAGVGLTVFSTMLLIYYCFAGRKV